MKPEFDEFTVRNLVDMKIIEKPLDGNHGDIHPKGNDFVASGVPFIMASDIKNSRIDFTSCKFISKKQAASLRKGFSKPGDVLLTHKASIGRTAIVPNLDDEYIMLTPQVTYYRVSDRSKLNNHYLKYYFDSGYFQSVLVAYSGAGSTRSYIGISEQLNLPVKVPHVSIQQNIASVLVALDSKIELNNRINAELESLARMLYEYWFVQFDFPDVNGKPYKSSRSKMEWNDELQREIPEGWSVLKLEDILWCNYESIGQETQYEFINYLDTSNLTDNLIDAIQYIDLEHDARPSRAQRIIKKDDILYSTVRPNQHHFGIIKDPIENLIASTGFAQLTSKSEEIPNEIIYLHLTSESSINRLQRIADSSVSSYPSISPTDLLGLNIALPKDEKTLKMIGSILVPLFQDTVINHQQNRRLAELRDWLLPMLMNGQVKVRD